MSERLFTEYEVIAALSAVIHAERQQAAKRLLRVKAEAAWQERELTRFADIPDTPSEEER